MLKKSMIPKSGNRFSEKTMLKKWSGMTIRRNPIAL